ncbi:MAG: endonuclease/exonuclease/phosphatase family protein [Gemmatimonadetes bacterium]|nr:endonuclease/exonuclease/phosphatase family protein [Gemmatimonadota bacterium]
MRARLSLVLTALVLLFFLEAQRVFFSVLFALVYGAVFPSLRPVALLGAVLPLAVLGAPLLPVFRNWPRQRRLTWAVAGAALARAVLSHPAFPARLAGSALGVGCATLFLAAAVGHLEPRRLAAAAALAVVVDQLLGLAGWSYDLSLQPAWAPLPVLLSLAAVAALWAWLGRPEREEDGGSSLERRAGGLRLRGAIALGLILFLETAALASPVVAARWTGVPYRAAAALLIVAGAAAVAMLWLGRGPMGRHRPAAVTLAGLATAGVLVPWAADGWGPALLMASGHAAALLLLGRALAPASGRRGGWTVITALLLFLTLQVLYGFTFFYAFTWPALQGWAPALLLGAGMALVASVLVIPRPAPSPPLRGGPAAAALLMIPAATALLLVLLLGRPAAPPGSGNAPGVRVATYNVHYGFDGDWRYGPEALARAVEASGADVVVLQEVGAGLPMAYGTDLSLWLGWRLGMQSFFAPTINRLLGDAALTRVAPRGFESRLLPPREADRKQVWRLELDLGGARLLVFGTHFGLTSEEQRAQVAGVLRFVERDGASVFAGDLNAGPGSEVVERLRAAGFRDAFELAGVAPAATAPAGEPRQRIDWIWIRGAAASHAAVLPHTASDHRLVVTTILP